MIAIRIVVILLILAILARAADPLPSWNEGPSKKRILEFVASVTTEGSRDFVPMTERIAVFDNDGTLWCEQPMYVQLAFALDRVKSLAVKHPEWRTTEPFKSALAGDFKVIATSGERGLVELVMATHAGMNTEEFATVSGNWLATARHPKFGRPYTECVYLPMLEVLAYLRASGFKTYIVSGGGVELIRVFAERVYGVPPEQVIGSTIRTKYNFRDGKPELARLPEIDFVDDKAGKPVAINKFIGRRPLMAFGNSDGDFEMLEWTTERAGPRIALVVHHTDADREYAYDRDSHFGKLVRGLDEGLKRGWVIVDVKAEWKKVFAFEK
jgi:hypothetical protein